MEPAAIRYKNPGAMWGKGNRIAEKWGAVDTVSLHDGLGQGNNIAVFPTYVQGICAQMDLWRSSPHYKNKRFADAIAVWCGGNSVERYISSVTKRVPGMARDTVMDDKFWRGPMAVPFLKAQAAMEAGKEYPAPDADWVEAQRIVLGGSAPVKVPPPPDVEPVPKKEKKPASKSTEILTSLATVLTTIGSAVSGFLTTWQGQVAIVVVIGLGAAYLIYKRANRGDISGWLW